jgi:hypothetical protein
MAKSKKNLIDGYFFMSVIDGDINIDCSGHDATLAAAFATIIVSNDKKGAGVKSILATAIAIAAAELEPKAAPKKKANPKQMNGAKSTEPFVKTRKKKAAK